MNQDHPQDPSTPPITEWSVREGMPVITFDGDTIGKVASTNGDSLIVRKGLLRSREITIPAATIENVGPDAVHLKVTREIVQSEGWGALDPADARSAIPQVSIGDPGSTAPLIGTFTADQAGTFGADSISPTQARRDQTDAIRDTDLATAGANADAEEIPANPIATGAVPAETGIPSTDDESGAQRQADAVLAEHDETLDEGVDSPHLTTNPSPLPAMNAPMSNARADVDDPGTDGDPNNLAGRAAVENEAIDPGLSGNTASEEDE